MENSLHQVPGDAARLGIFIVEDSEQVCERLVAMVYSIEGARCVGTAATAESAIRGIRDRHPDAVVLDIGLSQGNGFDVLRAFNAQSGRLPIYVLSNFSTEPYRRAALRLGATAFFDKTTQIENMRDVLRQLARETFPIQH